MFCDSRGYCRAVVDLQTGNPLHHVGLSLLQDLLKLFSIIMTHVLPLLLPLLLRCLKYQRTTSNTFLYYRMGKENSFLGAEQVKILYLYRHGSLLALVWGVLELFYDEILLDPISVADRVPLRFLAVGRARRIAGCRLGGLAALAFAQNGTGRVSWARGQRRAGPGGQGRRLLGLLHVDRGALNVMDHHRGGGHDLGLNGGSLGFEGG